MGFFHTYCMCWLGLTRFGFFALLSQQGCLCECVYLTDDVLVFIVKGAAVNLFSPPYYRSITANKAQLIQLISNKFLAIKVPHYLVRAVT